jgi:hypothetical protein
VRRTSTTPFAKRHESIPRCADLAAWIKYAGHRFVPPPGDLPAAHFKLGPGSGDNDDTFTIDYTNGNPLASMELTVEGTFGENNVIRVTGSAGNEAITHPRVCHSGKQRYVRRTLHEARRGRWWRDGDGQSDDRRFTGAAAILCTSIVRKRSPRFDVGENCTLVVEANGDRVLTTKSLTMDSSATLDLNDNDMIVDYTGMTVRAAAIQELINTARVGPWTGYGITSSAAASEEDENTTLGVLEATEYKSIYPSATTFGGEPIDNSSVLIKYTYYGDTDFNGGVNFDDYSRTDSGFSTPKTGWMNGDFDGSGAVNFDDYSTDRQRLQYLGQRGAREVAATQT